MTALVRPSGGLTLGAFAGVAALLGAVALISTLAAVIQGASCGGGVGDAAPSSRAAGSIPASYLALYQQAGREYGVPWSVLAGIGAIESDHGRSRAPGVRSGVNAFGCCAGPMQFNLRNGPPSTWDGYGVDGNHDGNHDPYDPKDAIPSAARYVRELLRAADGNLRQAILGYNHSTAYVNDVIARARAFAEQPPEQLAALDSAALAVCSADLGALTGPVNLTAAEQATHPRAFRPLPAWAVAPGRGPALIDARLHAGAVWMLRRYKLRVTAAREAGHNTHGDGTALDLIPADGSTQAGWDDTAGRLARDLGWNPACGNSGSRPACPLAPAIQFVGYEGYPNHGSPRTCTGGCPAHLHISWVSGCYGSAALVAPCAWVRAFPASQNEA